MLNFLRPAFARLFNPIVQGLARTPVTPNMITVAGTVGVSAAALSMFPIGELFPGAFTATVFVFTDMLDGQLARIKGNSGKYGAFLDSTMDRFGDAAVFGGITIWFMRTNHAARRGQPVLPGRRVLRLLRQGPRRGPRPERQRRLDRAPGTADHRPDLDRAVRPWHPVRAADRHVGAGRGDRAHARAADARRLPGRQVPAGPGRGRAAPQPAEQTTAEQTTAQTAAQPAGRHRGRQPRPRASRSARTAAQPAPTVARRGAGAAPTEEE